MDPFSPDLEVSEGADIGGAVDPSAGADPADGGAASEPAAPTEAPAALDQGQLEQSIASQIEQQLGPLVQALTPQPEPPTFNLDPLDDSFGVQTQELIRHEIQQALAGVLPTVQQMQMQQASQWVDQSLDQAMQSYKSPDGGDGDRTAVLYASAGFRAVTGDDAKAIVQARDYMVKHDADVAAKAVEAYKQSLQGGNQAQRDPAIGGAAISVEPRPGSYDEVMARYEARTAA
jgi:hypothetical protein